MSTTSPPLCRIRRKGWSASSGRSSWHCSGSARRTCPLAGLLRPSRERPAIRCPPTPRAGGSLYTDEREETVQASPRAVWRVIEGIGGQRGWYSFPLGWSVRGLIDRFIGGVGLRRAGATPIGCLWASRSTSGASRRSNRNGCCGCAPRCGCPASPGWSWACAGRRPDGVYPTGAVPPAWAARPRVLVGDLALPRGGVRRDEAQHRRGGWRLRPNRTRTRPRRLRVRLRTRLPVGASARPR